ncbi:DUF1444 domain-containing protein [Amphibacillus xylanus]|uniref:UPF0354 protein AXY_08940 n=1 Tax=Amphibacillus xylanus (strain ATCC 51415 / DSM 6626 / JCM 7361 / LMG 17667 / NBRC 15112 / Ep01) TaxID=698758 RepID=K0J355_AMPXN|nr:DUF1444 domain-containing protein [Amphibacillus xylanus]BAM47026.1 hypothetical protein AXY_08940 [Amphibacillus xylanus NBRC 15112]
MAITTLQLKKKLDQMFSENEWRTSFKRDKDQYRVEWKDTGKGVNIALPNLVAKYEKHGEQAIKEIVSHVKLSLQMISQKAELIGNEKNIFPVIRSTSFPKESKTGKKLVYQDHTAETRIYYAIDFGQTYQLIDQDLLDQANWSESQLKEMATFNLRSLPIDLKKDTVAGNDFYFVSANDGYDASRILNESWLIEMKERVKGELALAVPHQDTLIIADVQNDMGYDILAQMAMQYFAEGRVPITALSFLYENKKLEPIFILAKKKPIDQKNKQKDE